MRLPSLTLMCAACLALAAGPATAQIGNPAGMSPGLAQSAPGTPAPGQPNNADRLFVLVAGAAQLAEAETGRLAAAQAGSDAVKGFAGTMVDAHTGTYRELQAYAERTRLPLPDAPNAEQRAMHAWLQGLRGRAFDIGYLQAQLVAHQKSVQLLEWEISFGQDAPLQQLAMRTLPTVLGHLEHVQALLAASTGAAPQGLAAAATAGTAPGR